MFSPSCLAVMTWERGAAAGVALLANWRRGSLKMANDTKPDAVALLKADHRKVEELFKAFEKAEGASSKQELAEQICMELKIHTIIEEEVFYPACEGKVEEDMLKEAYVEHDAAKVLIAQIEEASPDAEFYNAKVKVLSEEIEHHVEEEEKRLEGLFAQARKAGLDMVELGQELAKRKSELQATYKSGGDLPTQMSTMPDQPAP
jgi:hemerythrin superfamily protein